MIPVNYSEKICIGSGGPRMDQSCYSYCEWEAPRRDKVTIEVTPTLRPSLYREKIICHRNCTKRNYNSTTFYKPALQQRHRAETVYLPPKCHVTKYSSAVDYHSKAEPRWYTNTLEVKPTTYSNSLVHKFGYYGTRLESEVTEDVASRPSSPVSSDEGFDQGEFCLESPHSLDSLGGSSRDSSPPREESYRSKLVVNGYTPGSLTTLDDYLSDASNDDVTEVWWNVTMTHNLYSKYDVTIVWF